jgi:hypothetical protein
LISERKPYERQNRNLIFSHFAFIILKFLPQKSQWYAIAGKISLRFSEKEKEEKEESC